MDGDDDLGVANSRRSAIDAGDSHQRRQFGLEWPSDLQDVALEVEATGQLRVGVDGHATLVQRMAVASTMLCSHVM